MTVTMTKSMLLFYHYNGYFLFTGIHLCIKLPFDIVRNLSIIYETSANIAKTTIKRFDDLAGSVFIFFVN